MWSNEAKEKLLIQKRAHLLDEFKEGVYDRETYLEKKAELEVVVLLRNVGISVSSLLTGMMPTFTPLINLFNSFLYLSLLFTLNAPYSIYTHQAIE